MDHVMYQIFKIISAVFLKKFNHQNQQLKIYINKIKNRKTNKIRSAYFLEGLTPEAMK